MGDVHLQQETVRDLHRDHRREHRTNQVQEIRDIIHGEQDGPHRADDRHRHGHVLAFQFIPDALGGNAGAPRVQKGGGDGGQYQNHQRRDAKARLHHDGRNIALAGESVMPTAIQTRISAPMTTHHTHGPTFRIPLVASAPS